MKYHYQAAFQYPDKSTGTKDVLLNFSCDHALNKDEAYEAIQGRYPEYGNMSQSEDFKMVLLAANF